MLRRTYTERTGFRRKYAKLSIGADVLQQIICTIKIRRAPTRHDNKDFRPIITRTSNILPLSVVTGDKAYDSEENHLLVREHLHAFSIIPARYEHVPIWRTHGRYRKEMKRGYSKLLYNQRNKDETIMSVIKRLFGEHLMSRLTRTQNRELSFRCITYNMHRLTNLFTLMFSTEPIDIKDLNINLGIFRGKYYFAMVACLHHRPPILYNYTSNVNYSDFSHFPAIYLKTFISPSYAIQYFVTTIKYK